VTSPRTSGVRLKDVTLREGLDTPGVDFSPAARARILRALDRAGIEEAEVVAPARVARDVERARSLPRRAICLSGLVYATAAGVEDEVARCAEVLDRVDLLMPLSRHRPPAAPAAKIRQLTSALRRAARAGIELGAGFPHAFTTDRRLLLTIARAAADAGARRLTLYDTSGAAEPFALHDRVAAIVESIALPIFFHGHDDLGLATANAWAAARAGASGLDVTVNGLGDRAGNVSLEQAAMLLHAHGTPTGVRLEALRPLARLVARESEIPVSPLAPIVGAYAFAHRSPAHLPRPREFEAFDPALIGATRRVVRAPVRRRP
jgi:homocitrate synthase NifV